MCRADEINGMTDHCEFSLCMPAFNEEDSLSSSILNAMSFLSSRYSSFEIVVVDDGSTDDTGNIVRSLAAQHLNIRLVSHNHNRGYGAAVTTGLRAARGNLILLMDSDGQFDLSDLPNLACAIDKFDLVVGYRQNRADCFLRRVIGTLWTILIRLLLRVSAKDVDCGFKLFRRLTLENIRLSASGACISPQILLECKRRGFSVCEVPVHHRVRKNGTATGVKAAVILRAIVELLELTRGSRAIAAATDLLSVT
jgi:glycosyltransferase involved in cell wall biosynthesis